jgi:hypothetical protein
MKTYYDAGLYKCRIMDQGFGEASTGTAQFCVRFLVLEQTEPSRDNIGMFSRIAYFPITDKTADRVMDDLYTLGFKGDNFESIDPRIEGHHSFVGKEVELMCSFKDDNTGTPRERWGFRGTGRPLNRDRVRKLNRFLTRRPVNSGPIPVLSDGVSQDDFPF